MPNNSKEAKPRLTQEEIMRKIYAKEYQQAMLFKTRFQHSKKCQDFRKAWNMPSLGFEDHQAYANWYGLLIKNTDNYFQSEKYAHDRQLVEEKRKEVYEKKITDSELNFFASQIWLRVPLHKYEYDVDQTTIHSGQPVYWREFIEKCILMNDFDVLPVRRPLPEPKVSWSNDTQMYELIIENIFPDTATKDFDDRWFTKKFRELQTKLPGYQKRKPRVKKKFEYNLGVLKTDIDMSNISDVQKAERIEGEIGSVDFAEAERKRANKLKQTRHRLKKMV